MCDSPVGLTVTWRLALQNASGQRLADLEALLDFLECATRELVWLSETEEMELARDWGGSLPLKDTQLHYQVRASTI